MHGVTACLLLAFLVVLTQAFIEPPEDPRLRAIRVNYVLSTTEPLEYTCDVDIGHTSFDSIQKIEVLTDALSIGDDQFDVLGSVSLIPMMELQLHNELDEELIVVGSISEDYSSGEGYVRGPHIDVTWKTLTGGNCLTYKCEVTFANDDGTTETLAKEIKVRTADGSLCGNRTTNAKIIQGLIPLVEECCTLANTVEAFEQSFETLTSTWDVDVSALSAKVQENTNLASQLLADAQNKLQAVQQHSANIDTLQTRINNLTAESALSLQFRDLKIAMLEQDSCPLEYEATVANTLNGIDRERYFVSERFENSFYALTKNSETFVIANANDKCRMSGGYLAEVESRAEVDFLFRFASGNGHPRAYVGANDIAMEGTYVQYNSQNPMSLDQNLWHEDQPNNYKNQDCVEFFHGTGLLNDWKCFDNRGNICEIPIPASTC